MTTLPHSEHTARRKAYAPHYNPSHLIQFEPEVKDSVVKVVNVSRIPMLLDVRTSTHIPDVADPREPTREDVHFLSRGIPPPHG